MLWRIRSYDAQGYQARAGLKPRYAPDARLKGNGEVYDRAADFARSPSTARPARWVSTRSRTIHARARCVKGAGFLLAFGGVSTGLLGFGGFDSRAL